MGDAYTIKPLTPDRFDDLVAVLGKGGISGCWCMYWSHPTTREWGEGTRGGSTAPNKAAFRERVAAGPPPGLLAYAGPDPVAWCRVVPRSTLPGLARSRYFATDLDVAEVWSLACFVVKRSHRGRGLVSVLVAAAMDFAAAHGGRVLEAYPWDTDEEKHPRTIYTGLASTFARLGFEVVQRRAPHKPMMRHVLQAT